MAQALVADVAGEFGGKVQVVAHDVFKMHCGHMGVGQQVIKVGSRSSFSYCEMHP